ncbi:MAG: T9SS type A sorting domain-containing protein [Chitinophagales bacterium]
MIAQIPSNPHLYVANNCSSNNKYNIISATATNECGAYLVGYPFTIHVRVSGSIFQSFNNNISAMPALSPCIAASNWKYYALSTSGVTDYLVKPGYANETWRGNYVGTCCPVDTMPGYSPDASVGLNFSTPSPASYTFTPTQLITSPYAKATFLITNPYAPSYTVNGIRLNMNQPAANPFIVAKCGANSIPLVNSTNTFGTTVQYYTTVYNSDVNKTVGTVHWQSPSWQPIPPTPLDATGNPLASAVNGNYYIIKVAVRCLGSTGTGSFIQGHFKYVVPSTPTATYNINSAAVSSACATPTSFFNCNAITLNNTSNADATQYLVELWKATSNCGTYTSVYNSGYLSTFPTDLKNLPGTNGTTLQTNTGFYQVRLTTKNACGTVSSTSIGYINIATGPTNANASFSTNCITKATQTITIGSCTVPVNTQFTYWEGATGCATGNYKFPMSNSVSTPNEVGRLNTIFDLTGVSGGTGSTSYTITLKSEFWDGTNWIVMNYNGTPETISSPTTVSLAGLLDDDIANPYYSGFSDQDITPNGSIYRITVTVINECGSFSKSQIIKLNTTKLKRVGNFEEEEDIKTTKALTVFPNPFTDKVSIQLPTISESTKNTSIEIIDMAGKVVFSKNIDANSTDLIEINTLLFSSGIYLYKIKTEEKVYTGKIIKK